MSDQPIKKKSRRGRPNEGREAFTVHLLPDKAEAIDKQIQPHNRHLNTRGKVIESKF